MPSAHAVRATIAPCSSTSTAQRGPQSAPADGPAITVRNSAGISSASVQAAAVSARTVSASAALIPASTSRNDAATALSTPNHTATASVTTITATGAQREILTRGVLRDDGRPVNQPAGSAQRCNCEAIAVIPGQTGGVVVGVAVYGAR